MFNFFYFEKIKIFFKILKFKSINIINVFSFLKFFFNKFLKNNFTKIKFGIDPTYKSIHVGHIYYFQKIIKCLKILKIKIIIILGLFTSIINNNLKYFFYKNNLNYIFYVFKYIFKKIKNIKIYYNTEWQTIISIKEKNFLLSLIKYNKFLNIKKYNINNIYYILAQSYDSVFTSSDLELGGLDQKINFIFCYLFLKNFFKIFQSFFLFPLLIKNFFIKISKSNRDNFFNKKKIIKILNNLNKTNFENYYKFLINVSKNFFIYLFYSFNILKIKNYLFLNILNKYFKINKFLFKIKNKNNINFLFIFFSLIYFKIFKFLMNFKIFKNFKNLKKIFIINNILIKNKNFLFFKGNYKLKIIKKFFYYFRIL